MSLLLQVSSDYKYFGTVLDTRDNLNTATEGKLLDVCVSAAQVAGQMALQLVHDQILSLDVDEYTRVIRKNVVKINSEIKRVGFSSPNTWGWECSGGGGGTGSARDSRCYLSVYCFFRLKN